MGKNIIIAVIFVVIIAVGYFAYSKAIKPKVEAQKKQDAEDERAAAIQDKKIQLVESLSQTEQQKAYSLANQIYDDMRGWDAHNMLLYRDLKNSSDAFLYYFITKAYPSYDKKLFSDRTKLQNWRVTTAASKRANLDNDEAETLIAELRQRIENFKIV